MIQSPIVRLNENATVAELNEESVPCWKEYIIQELFSVEEVLNIKSIPLSPIDRDDLLVCIGTTNGLFTAKSVYHLHMTLVAKNKCETSQQIEQLDSWKTI